MAFPLSPIIGQHHKEGDQEYIYTRDGTWLVLLPGGNSGGTVSHTGSRPVFEVDVLGVGSATLLGLDSLPTGGVKTGSIARVKGASFPGDGGGGNYVWNGSTWLLYFSESGAAGVVKPRVVADAEERKAITDGAAGFTQVTQADLPGVLWLLVEADATQDSSWFGLPYTIDPAGEFPAVFILASSANRVPAPSELSQAGGHLAIGDGLHAGGNRVTMLPLPDGYVRCTYLSLASGQAVIGTEGTSYHCTSIDGAAPSYGLSNVGLPIGYPASLSASTQGAIRTVDIWPADAVDSGRVGDIYFLALTHDAADPNQGLCSIDLSSITTLRVLVVGGPLRVLDLSRNAGLETLHVHASSLAVLDLSTNSQLLELSVSNTPLLELDLSPCPLLESLDCPNTALRTLDLSPLQNLVECNADDSSLKSVDISGLIDASISLVNCVELTEIKAVSTQGGPGDSPGAALDLSGCSAFTTDALGNMLTQMLPASSTPSYIYGVGAGFDMASGTPAVVAGQSFSQSAIEALLTAKSYTLVLTDGALTP